MSLDEQNMALMASDRWREAQQIARQLRLGLDQHEASWTLLPGATARTLADGVKRKANERMEALREKLDDAERCWKATLLVAEAVVVEPSGPEVEPHD